MDLAAAEFELVEALRILLRCAQTGSVAADLKNRLMSSDCLHLAGAGGSDTSQEGQWTPCAW